MTRKEGWGGRKEGRNQEVEKEKERKKSRKGKGWEGRGGKGWEGLQKFEEAIKNHQRQILQKVLAS